MRFYGYFRHILAISEQKKSGLCFTINRLFLSYYRRDSNPYRVNLREILSLLQRLICRYQKTLVAFWWHFVGMCVFVLVSYFYMDIIRKKHGRKKKKDCRVKVG